MAKDDKRPYVGVDLGGTNIQAGVVDHNHKVLGTKKVKTGADDGAEAVVDRLARTIEKAIDKANLKKSDVGGVCVGAPGTVDIKKGVVVNATNLRWNDFPLVEALTKQVDLPVTLDNDVNVGTWGEYRVGAAKEFKDVLGIFVGTGIGGGLVLNGELYHGHYFTAGEIGHTVLMPDGPIGRRSLENLASRTNAVNLLINLIRANNPSEVTDITGGDLTDIRSKVLAEAVQRKDALTLQVMRDAAHYVGTSIANTVTLLSLPCVVIGGGLTEAMGEPWMKWVRESFEKLVFPPELRRCKVVAASLGDDAGLVGAALLARDRLSMD